MEDQKYYFDTILLCYNLLHKDYCATLNNGEQWHDKYIEHICHRLEKIIKEHNDQFTYISKE